MANVVDGKWRIEGEECRAVQSALCALVDPDDHEMFPFSAFDIPLPASLHHLEASLFQAPSIDLCACVALGEEMGVGAWCLLGLDWVTIAAHRSHP